MGRRSREPSDRTVCGDNNEFRRKRVRFNFKDSIIAVLIISIIIIIVVPLLPSLLDVLLILNISLALVILLTSIYVTSPLEMSSFPTLLLIATLFRLSLNISSTRLILGNGGSAGHVISTFGNFVVAGSPVVGLIIFLIIVVIQFVVITKGSERVSEVSARFTLDAMPGKQMAIDADLNAGLIDERTAKKRREDIQKHADFYGAMDGASKFVKGDAIAGIIITLINLIGGIVIGLVIDGQPFAEVVSIYTLATVGDGLVSQIPALLISTSSGIILTRSASGGNLNNEIVEQLLSQYIVMFIGGGALLLMTFIPGLPKIPLIAIGSILLLLGYRLYTTKQEEAELEEKIEERAQRQAPKEEEYNISDYIFTDPVVVEFGYNLVPMIDRNQGGKLLDRLIMIRRQLAVEWGIIVPQVRVKDNGMLIPNKYIIKIQGINAGEGEILSDYFMAMNTDDAPGKIDGIETREPAFGMNALWITPEMVDRAEMNGYTVIDPVSVIATHISEVVKSNSHELLGRQEVKTLVDELEKKYPALVEDIIPDIVNLGTLQKVLGNLLEEGIRIKNLPTIVEILGDYGRTVPDIDQLTEHVRLGLKKEICNQYAYDNRLELLIVSPELEQRISDTINNLANGLKPDEMQAFAQSTKKEFNQALDQGYNPVLVTTPLLRSYMKGLTMQSGMDIDVMSVSEIDNKYELKVVGNISI